MLFIRMNAEDDATVDTLTGRCKLMPFSLSVFMGHQPFADAARVCPPILKLLYRHAYVFFPKLIDILSNDLMSKCGSPA